MITVNELQFFFHFDDWADDSVDTPNLFRLVVNVDSCVSAYKLQLKHFSLCIIWKIELAVTTYQYTVVRLACLAYVSLKNYIFLFNLLYQQMNLMYTNCILLL